MFLTIYQMNSYFEVSTICFNKMHKQDVIKIVLQYYQLKLHNLLVPFIKLFSYFIIPVMLEQKSQANQQSKLQFLKVTSSYQKKGNQALSKYSYLQAHQYYSQALTQDPTNPLLHYNKSIALYKLQKYNQSVECAMKAIQLKPNYKNAYFKAIQALMQEQRFEEAENMLNVFQKLFPEQISVIQKIQLDLLEEKKGRDNSDQIQKMTTWLLSCDSKFDKIKIKKVSDRQRGTVARRNIKVIKFNKPEQEIIFIPKKAIVFLEQAKEFKDCKILIDNNVKLISPKHTYLTLYLLHLFQFQNQFSSYLEMLPKEFSSFPIFFSNEQLRYLQGSNMLSMIKEKLQDLLMDYQLIKLELKDFNVTFKRFSQIRMLVSSRIFGINVNDKKTDALVPLADMLNHKLPKQTSWYYSDDREGFFVISHEAIARGQQIFDSYGKKCNTRFFLNYGFIDSNNMHDQLVQFRQNDKLYEEKVQFTNGLHCRIFKLPKYLNSETVEFFEFVRLINISDLKILLDLKKKNQGKKMQVPPLGVAEEKELWQYILNKIKVIESNFETTLAQDRELLKSQNLSNNIRNCIKIRTIQKEVFNCKKILEYYRLMGNSMIYLLQLKPNQIRWAYKRVQFKQFQVYIEKIILKKLLNNN